MNEDLWLDLFLNQALPQADSSQNTSEEFYWKWKGEQNLKSYKRSNNLLSTLCEIQERSLHLEDWGGIGGWVWNKMPSSPLIES